ncbi:hypothetical protein O181_129545 [Austropuccinia psidii MF-1]|uniref:Uncharacterized protein n=1 Tax=Austropuccinia psidii MF-1 TaxID=1389203 RepID=A0A9Q3KXB8_9BASI|nr:hypothetical protein [Austropuccinia psidii MF-1]
MLKEISVEEEREPLKCINTLEIKEDITSMKMLYYENRLHYSFPLGLMKVFVGKEEYTVMEMVDKGSELEIIAEDAGIKASISNRKLKMNLRGIRGNTASGIIIAEFIQLIFPSGEAKEIYLFISKGEVHKVTGGPFLEDNKIIIEYPDEEGEIFSYLEAYGRILCLPICKLAILEWKIGTPSQLSFFQR